jgi:hypothetical protein
MSTKPNLANIESIAMTMEEWEAEWAELDRDEITETERHVQHALKVDSSTFAILFNYFNFKLNNAPINVEEYDSFSVKYIIRGVEFINNIPQPAPSQVNYNIVLTYAGVETIVNCESYMESGELKHYISIHSKDKLTINGNDFYDKLFNSAVQKSELKGGYFTMPNNEFSWKVLKLKELGYGDIFLPEDLMDDAKLFVELYKKKGIMSRYMLSGVPGTGKTELTRVLSSILKKDGVTIIKTNPCELLKSKMDLAKTLAPALIIMDDVDLYLGNRNNGAYSTLLGQFLDVLDGVDKIPDNVGIIASTNAPHLIDLAAQRPGRFNKMLFFDNLTKENIKGIINKSLKNLSLKFGEVDDTIKESLLSDTLIDYFFETKETGSYIYETIISLKNKMDVMGETEVDINKLVDRLKRERKTLKKKLATNEIKSTYEGEEKKMGFN